jgi:pSer/pThr/pTyr-binding forkhead associated (FHA) protein
MQVLVRYIIHHRKGSKVFREQVLSTKILTLGRGAGQQIFLADSRAALQHALITKIIGQRFLIQSRALSGIRVNGRLLQSGIVKEGDVIRIGQTELRLFAPPPDCDLALEIELQQDSGDNAPPLHSVPVKIVRPPLRRWSWLLFSALLLLFLALPAAHQYLYGYYAPWLDALAQQLGTEDEPAELPTLPWIFTDRFWSSGETARAHHFFRHACATCHQAPFERVPDMSCTNCHDKTHPHVDPYFFDLDRLNQTRCAECHREHNGSHALIERDDSLCSDCHKDLSQQGVKTDLGDARDFGDHHPAFRFSLLRHDKGQDNIKRVAMEDEENFYEQSNLEFSHSTHTDRRGLSTLDGIFHLWCEDCHVHQAGSPHLEPVTYEKNCRACHPLIFDPTVDSQRQVPHGKRDEVMHTLYEYYTARALEGGYDDGQSPEFISQARFPDENLEDKERLQALEWARQKAEEVSAEVFEFSVCVQCHQVTQISTNPPRWDIAPVRITRTWLPKARFSHEKHKTMDCLFCHAVPESEHSADILIPDIEVCRECHGGAHATDKLASTCVDCHGFHIAKEFSMRATRAAMGED